MPLSDQQFNQLASIIMASVKQKDVYQSFEQALKDQEVDPIIPENLCFEILLSYANKVSDAELVLGNFNKLLMTGYQMQQEDFEKFVRSLEEPMEFEILAIQTIYDMLDEGDDFEKIRKAIEIVIS